MSRGGEPGHLHPQVTSAHGYAYFLYDKHHGRGGPEAACWALDLSEHDEFAIFDQADDCDSSDEWGNLYGLCRWENGQIRDLGTLNQQVAKFPRARSGQPWHGFPLGPLKDPKPSDPPVRPLPKDVLRKMQSRDLLSDHERRRLEKGKHA